MAAWLRHALLCNSLQRFVSRDARERSPGRPLCTLSRCDGGRCLCLSGASRLHVGGPVVSGMDGASTVVGAVAVGRLAAWFIVTLRSVHFISLFLGYLAAVCCLLTVHNAPRYLGYAQGIGKASLLLFRCQCEVALGPLAFDRGGQVRDGENLHAVCVAAGGAASTQPIEAAACRCAFHCRSLQAAARQWIASTAAAHQVAA